jgi:hypothetical protein
MHAYIEIALTGKTFCTSARKGFMLILKQPVKLALVTSLGEAIIKLGEYFVGILSGVFCYLVVTEYEKFKKDLFEPFIPTLVSSASHHQLAVVIGYSVGSIFMTVYGMAANTILHCYLLDIDLHKEFGGAQGHAKFAPKKLRKFTEEHCK